MVEGARAAMNAPVFDIFRGAEAPSTALRAVPLSRFAGEDCAAFALHRGER
jgi:hypothetical protein